MSALVVDAIVLAAGVSSRLGRAKQLLPFAGTTLLGHAVAVARGSGARRVVVVVGARLDEVRAEAARLGADYVENSDWQSGMGSSLRAGMHAIAGAGDERATRDSPDGVLILLCDQPRVAVADVARIVERWRAHPDAVVACEYDGTLGAPALFPRAAFAQLRALDGGAGAKAVILGQRDRLQRVDCPAASVDIDTESDWTRLCVVPPSEHEL